MQFSSCQGHVDACLDMQPCTKMKKDTIRAGDGTALYAAYMVNTFDMINTVDLVYTVNTIDSLGTDGLPLRKITFSHLKNGRQPDLYLKEVLLTWNVGTIPKINF